MRNFLIVTVARNLGRSRTNPPEAIKTPPISRAKERFAAAGPSTQAAVARKAPPAPDWAPTRFPGQCGSDQLLNRRATG